MSLCIDLLNIIFMGAIIINVVFEMLWKTCDAGSGVTLKSFAYLTREKQVTFLNFSVLIIFRFFVLVLEVYMAALPSLAFDSLVDRLEVHSMQVRVDTYSIEDGHGAQSFFARELEWFVKSLRSKEIAAEHSFKIAQIQVDKVTLGRVIKIGSGFIAIFAILWGALGAVPEF
jgi:hypothetical protein